MVVSLQFYPDLLLFAHRLPPASRFRARSFAPGFAPMPIYYITTAKILQVFFEIFLKECGLFFAMEIQGFQSFWKIPLVHGSGRLAFCGPIRENTKFILSFFSKVW
jgi:hypothetical protein